MAVAMRPVDKYTPITLSLIHISFTVIPMNVLSLLAIACAAALALELMGKLGIKGAQIGDRDA